MAKGKSPEERWRNDMIEELAKDLWRGYQSWALETHNLYIPDYEATEELGRFNMVKGAVVAMAKIVVESQELAGFPLKTLKGHPPRKPWPEKGE